MSFSDKIDISDGCEQKLSCAHNHTDQETDKHCKLCGKLLEPPIEVKDGQQFRDSEGRSG